MRRKKCHLFCLVIVLLLIFATGMQGNAVALAMDLPEAEYGWKCPTEDPCNPCSKATPINTEKLSAQSSLESDRSERPAKNVIENFLYKSLQNMDVAIDISEYRLSGDEIFEYLSYMGLKYPELFPVTTGIVRWTVAEGYIVQFEPEYSMSKEEYEAALPIYEEEVKRVAALVDPTWSRTEKVLTVYNHFALNYVYDQELKANDAYNFFVNHIGVCRSFTLAMEAVLPLVGVPTSFVRSVGLGHSWNIVQLEDGEFYHLDATWNGTFNDAPNYCRYNYFLLSDSQLLNHDVQGKRDWQYDRPEGYPMTTDFHCTSNTYDNYFWSDTSTMASMIIHESDSWYFLTQDGYLMQWDGSGQPVQLTKTIGPYSTYSTLICREGTLYYSTSFTLERINLKTKNPEQIGEGAAPNTAYAGFTIQILENGIMTLACSIYDFGTKSYSTKIMTIDLCNYIVVDEGGYQYCLDMSELILQTSGKNPVILTWHDEMGRMILVNFYGGQGRNVIHIPNNAGYCKIMSVSDAVSWIPICAAKFVEL